MTIKMRQNLMKKFILPTIGLLAALLTAQAQYFFPTNLVVVQQTINPTTGAGITLIQFQTNGTLVSSTNLPSAGSKAIILSTSTTEGFVTLSANSNLLVLGGYNATAGSGSPSAATSTNDPRAVATVDAYDNYALPISNPNIYSTFNIRAAASDGVGNFWTSGSGGTGANLANGELGIIYVGTATQPTNVCVAITGTGNERCLEIYNGNLYVDTGSATHGVFLISNVAGYYPEVTAAGTNSNVTNVMAQGTGSGPYAFQINSAGTLAYVAEDNLSGVIKYTNSGNGWGSNYTLSVLTAGASSAFTNAYGCAVDWSQSPPVIYATTSETTTNRLVRIVDNGPSSVPALLATSAVSNAFRGVRFGPQLYAYISVQPLPFSGNPGATATFSATVLGVPTPTYQWYSNSVANTNYVAIPGATSATLTLPNITTAQSGSLFILVVSNVYGSSSSTPVALTVNNPAITSQPVGATNFPGTSSVTLCVTATGTGTLSYQWLSNGVPVPGAQSSCYTPPVSAVSNTTAYSVIVTNTAGLAVTSTTSATTYVVYSPYLLYDTFSYPNGNLFGDPGSPWTDINGTNPELVISNHVQIAYTNATTDAQSLFDQTVNNTVVWSSFILNVSQLPSNAGGAYFANFEDTNFGFYGRIFLLTSNNPSLTPDISPVAYPGTYRLGIANAQTDSSGSATTGPSAVVELDMAPGINYQVVAYYDISGSVSQLAVNPSVSESNQVSSSIGTYNGTGNAPSPLTSGPAEDRFTPSGLPMAAYGLRQRTGGGIMLLTDLEVSYDWNGAYSGFAAVTAGDTPVKAVIGLLSPGVTNYVGNSNVLEVAASGIDLTYAWYQNGVALSDGNSLTGSATYALTLNPEVGTNSGNYTVVIANEAGSVTSSVVAVSINTTPTAPSFTLPGGLEPVGATVAEGGSVTFTATAVGTGPITYAWNFDGSPISPSATGSSLTLTGLTTNQAGSYSVTATGGVSPPATSSNAVLIVTGPVFTNIHYLRSLINPSTFVVTDTTTLYSIQGTVVNATNLTSGTTASYYVQDSTGGINLFITGDSTFRPALGSVLTATGVLSAFDDNLELDVTAGSATQVYSNTGVIAPLPTPAPLSWATATANPSSTVPTIEGSLVVMTNVYFETAGDFVSTTTLYPITNNTGEAFDVFVSAQDTNFDGQPIPAFATSVTGILYQTSATAYALIVTRYSDIVTSSPVTITNLSGMESSGTNFTLKWTAVPNTASYSVLYSTNVAGPYTNKLATGLVFSTTNGTYTDTLRSNMGNFYEVSSP
jgi:hypothetical protein